MDVDTAVLLALTACAFGWFIAQGILEERKKNRAIDQARADNVKRLQRLKRLYGRG